MKWHIPIILALEGVVAGKSKVKVKVETSLNHTRLTKKKKTRSGTQKDKSRLFTNT